MGSATNYGGDEKVHDQSPIEEVALTVPTTDDPTLPVMTFRMWSLGLLSCIILAIANQFFSYRSNPLTISGFSAQIAVLPLGHLMAATLPTKNIRFPCTNWHFSLNPGPFNIKEHVLITIFANAGAGGVYAISILTIIKAFYKRHIGFVAAWLLSVTTQVLGFGWAGIFRKILVETSYMWWPVNLVQVSLFRYIWNTAKAALGDENIDVHTRLMRENYKAVPQSWFMILLVLTIGVAIATCQGFKQQLQLPWWGVLLACMLAVTLTLPIGIITATTNMTPGMKIINEYIVGYLYPGRPVANVIFKTYGNMTMVQAITFLSDFKLGHYMKIPPRSMFVVQVVGTIVAASVYFGMAWWLLESIENMCTPELLPEGSPWTCPYDRVFYNASVIWGVVGPKRIFGSMGLYRNQNWFFLVGAIAPIIVWILSKLFCERKWIRRINMPILIGATNMMPPATAVNFICWGTFGFIFNYVIYRRNKQWWSRHNYVFSAAMDAGVAFMGLLSYFALQMNERSVSWWGGPVDDHCHVASCPTLPGIMVDGCPN